MKNSAHYSPETKRRIAVVTAFLIVLSAVLGFNLKKTQDEGVFVADGRHYDLVKEYMQSQYTDAYSDYFEVAYVENLGDYKESFNDRTNTLEAEFTMHTYYKYPYRDPDTVPKVISARKNGDMGEYKRLYEECNTPKSADYKLKIEAKIGENGIEDTAIYGGSEDGTWIYLENGLKDYIIED